MTPQRDPLGSHIELPVSAERAERTWEDIAPQLGQAAPAGRKSTRSSKSLWIGFAAAAVVVLAVGVGVSMYGNAPEYASLEGLDLTTRDQPVQWTLSDGSRLDLGAQSGMTVEHDRADAQQIQLARGTASFDVESNPERDFVVVAGHVRVTVVGTRFIVTRGETETGSTVDVQVIEGTVRVEDIRGGVTRLLQGGESWTVIFEQGQSAGERAEVTDEITEIAEDAESAQRQRRQERRARRAEASNDVAADDAPQPPDAEELFNRARLARRGGQAREAVNAYTEFLRAYPRDPRAGLVHFEIGRLRIDRLSDTSGGIASLSRSLRYRGAHREDALARLALAHARAGQVAACQRYRRQYLDRYPGGVHAGSVTSACP